MTEGKGVALAILGIVSVIAIVGLVLLFTGATGQGIYSGTLRQMQGWPGYEKGEEPLRYTSPVPPAGGGTFYSHRKSWERGLYDKDVCPYNDYPTVKDPARVGGRTDCIPSPTRSPYFCCRFGGSKGQLGLYD